MAHKRRLTLMVITLLMIFIFSACRGTPAEEEIYNHLEETVSVEKEFVQQQNEITDLEKQEQEIYEKITELGMNDLDDIKELSNQAKAIIAERLDKVIKEEESINDSKEEFLKIKDLIEQVKDETIAEKATEMYDAMMVRYEMYEELNEAYKSSLTLEEELYTLIQTEEIEEKDVTEHIGTLNTSYELVLELNDEFNEVTSEYNLLKKEFYTVADMNVVFEEN